MEANLSELLAIVNRLDGCGLVVTDWDEVKAALAEDGYTNPKAKNKSVTLNEEQKLYCIPAGEGYTTLGYDYCAQRTAKVAAWLAARGIESPYNPHARGTLAAYRQYSRILRDAETYCTRAPARCEVELTPQLAGLEGKRVEVVDNSGEVRRFIVGRSTGWMPCHLEIETSADDGGGAADQTYKSVRVVPGGRR